eukprot:jgi/Mesvir1/23052/Mv08169-RA.1
MTKGATPEMRVASKKSDSPSSDNETIFLKKLSSFLKTENGAQLKEFPPTWRGRTLDLYGLYKAITRNGGMEEVIRKKRWQVIWPSLKNYDPKTTDSSFQLKTIYLRWLFQYEQRYFFGKKGKIEMAEVAKKFGGAVTGRRAVAPPGAAMPSRGPRTTKKPSKEDSSARDPPKLVPARTEKSPPQSTAEEHYYAAPAVRRLPYKRPFFTVTIHPHEIEQDLALVTNFKRKRATRGGGQQAESQAVPDAVTQCIHVVLQLRVHSLAGEFTKPVERAGWPPKARQMYQTLCGESMDLSLIQAKLSCGNFDNSHELIEDVRGIFRAAVLCAGDDEESRGLLVSAHSRSLNWGHHRDKHPAGPASILLSPPRPNPTPTPPHPTA